jgi:Na+-translocating ferredoxin:NAD+ oxidoreductase RnfD subunit
MSTPATTNPTAPPPASAARDPRHTGVTSEHFTASVILGLMIPIAAGVVAFGFRSLAVIAGVIAATMAASWLLRSERRFVVRPRPDRVLAPALLLAAMLPADWAGGSVLLDGQVYRLWPLIPVAGLLLGGLLLLLSGLGSGRLNAILVSYLAVTLVASAAMMPAGVLQRSTLAMGDVLDLPARVAEPKKVPWFAAPQDPSHAAIRMTPPAQQLILFTSGSAPPQRSWTTLEGLLRDTMPPLEDLILLGVPAPIGSASAIAVIVGGLLMVYRGVTDWRIPLVIVAAAFAALLVLPVPVVVTDQGVQRFWFAGSARGVGWPMAVTLANYELLASPLLFTAFFLAPLPSIRPMNRGARVIYAACIGVAAAAMQLYVSVHAGPYLALLAISLLSPSFDRFARARAIL